MGRHVARHLGSVALVIHSLVLIPSAAPAQRLQQNETRSLDAKSGEPVLAYRFSALGPDCIGREPEIHVTKAPAHGHVDLKPESYEVGRVLEPSATQICIGRRVQGLAIYYTSEKAFDGTDEFAVSVKLRGGTVYRTYRVTVH
jgi:hypothetical protein